MPKYNPLIFSGLDFTGSGGPAGDVQWKSAVQTEAALISLGGTEGDARVVLDTEKIYVYDGSKWVDTTLTISNIGATPKDQGMTLSLNSSEDIVRRVLNLEPADATHPGIITTGAQELSGDKTLKDNLTVDGSIDAKGGINSSTGTLSIGSSTAAITIGGIGSTITLQGDTTYEHVTNLYVKDKTVTINDGGAAASAGGAGIEVEENNIITGYSTVSSDRNSWELKAPNTAGIAVITPGTSGITLNQSSHDPVTLASVGSSPAAAGASLSGQQLTLQPADATHPGVVSTTTQTFGGQKTFANLIATGNPQIDYNIADSANWSSPAPTKVNTALDDLAARFVEQDTVTNEPTGFPNRTDSLVSFNDGTHTLSIAPAGAAYDVYIRGKKYTKTTTESLAIPTPLVGGNYYFYFNETGVLDVTSSFTPAIIQQYAFIAVIYWNSDTSTHTYFAEERHGLTMDGATHSYLHTVFGARFISGLALQGFTIGNGTLNSHAQFTSDQGQIRDEDLLLTILAELQIPILYRQGQLWRKKTADSFPVIYSGTAGYTGANGLLPYNQNTGGAWQLTQVQSNKYVLVHFFGTNDKEAGQGLIGIQGIAQYDSIETARTAANSEITSLSGLPFAEFVPVGTVLFQTATSFGNTPKAAVVQVDGANYVDFRGTQLYTPAGEATTHSLLSGLGNDDHVQYLLVNGDRAMAGALDMGTHAVINASDPTNPQDAATKAYTDAKISDTAYGPSWDTVTTIAPSKNAVYDVLVTKQDTGSYITALTSDVAASGPGSAAATIQPNVVSNTKLAKMAASTIKGNATGGSADPQDLSAASVRTLISVIPDYSGDIPRTTLGASFSGGVASPITNLSFSTATVRGFDVQLAVVRGSLFADYNIKGIQKSSSWEMTQDYVGDDVGLIFTIDAAGQMYFTSQTAGSATILFKATTI